MNEILERGVSDKAKVRIAKTILWTLPAVSIGGVGATVGHWAENHFNSENRQSAAGYARCLELIKTHGSVIQVATLMKQQEEDCGLQVYLSSDKTVQVDNLGLAAGATVKTISLNQADLVSTEQHDIHDANTFDHNFAATDGTVGAAFAELVFAGVITAAGLPRRFRQYP